MRGEKPTYVEKSVFGCRTSPTEVRHPKTDLVQINITQNQLLTYITTFHKLTFDTLKPTYVALTITPQLAQKSVKYAKSRSMSGFRQHNGDERYFDRGRFLDLWSFIKRSIVLRVSINFQVSETKGFSSSSELVRIKYTSAK